MILFGFESLAIYPRNLSHYIVLIVLTIKTTPIHSYLSFVNHFTQITQLVLSFNYKNYTYILVSIVSQSFYSN